MKGVITRRDLLKAALGGIATLSSVEVAESQQKEKRSKVVLIRHPDVLDKSGRINTKVLQEMLDNAVTTLVGVKDPVEAWKRLVKPTDLVGIKTNVWAFLPTPREVEEAIQQRLIDAGVKPDNIRINDRQAHTVLAPCTALINVRPVRTHWWSGIGGCIKNYIMFITNPADYHNDACSPLASIWHLPIVKGKTRLNILLALTPLFHGRGPHHYDPRYVWQYKGIFVGFDPVAVDAMGLKLIQAKRLQFFSKEIALETSPKHILVADKKYKLGTSDPNQIEFVKLGWTEGALI
ncbi:MAG: DUF362 domain-containing protein [Armatimonadetes bacterium]|nr:DUF362 domain-containing protein [Armatimonadota bacterium]MDW8029858.1 DUF362 domain-containing protein [Armatimonadota bacterium]